MAARRVVRTRACGPRRARRRGDDNDAVAAGADHGRPRAASAQRADRARPLARRAQFLAAGRIAGSGHRYRRRRRFPAVVRGAGVSPPAQPEPAPGAQRAIAGRRPGPAPAASGDRSRRAGGGRLPRWRAGVAGGWPGGPRPPLRHRPGHGGMAHLARAAGRAGRPVAQPVPAARWSRGAGTVERRPAGGGTGVRGPAPVRRRRSLCRSAGRGRAARHPAGRCPRRHRRVAPSGHSDHARLRRRRAPADRRCRSLRNRRRRRRRAMAVRSARAPHPGIHRHRRRPAAPGHGGHSDAAGAGTGRRAGARAHRRRRVPDRLATRGVERGPARNAALGAAPAADATAAAAAASVHPDRRRGAGARFCCSTAAPAACTGSTSGPSRRPPPS